MPERLETLHKASLYAVVWSAFLALVPGGRVGLPTVAGFAVASVASWGVDAAGWTSREHVRWWNALAAAFLGLSVLHVVWTDTSPLMAGIRFILLLVVIRLVSRHRQRDELQLYALALLTMAAATAINEGLGYGLAFAGFVLTGTFSLALFHLKWELRERSRTASLRSIPFDRRYVVVLASLSVAIFASSLLLFVAFPRIGLGFFQDSSRDGVEVGGLSDSVRLGTHGVLRDDGEVVLRVEFPLGRPSDFESLHWRSISFDRYDGRGWQRTLGDADPIVARDDRYDVSHRFGPQMPSASPRDIPERMRLYVEPLGAEVLPTLWPTDTVEFQLTRENAPAGSPRAGRLAVDPYGDLSHTVPSEIGIPYTLHLRRRPDPNRLRELEAGTTRERTRLEPFLQMPEAMPRIASLARRLTAEVETRYAKAEAIESHLRRNFTYTTDLPDYDPETPIEDFLFEKRRGHCEYYATSMTLMLRTLEIPARMVNGFLGGEWNSVGGYLAVRQQDAHSWVEFHLPGYGWIPMDPTPAAAIHRDRSSPFDWLRQSWDAMRMIWLQWVLEYDLDTQLRMLRDLGDWADAPAPAEPTDEASAPDSDGEGPNGRRFALWGGLAVICLLAVVATRRYDARWEWGKVAVSALLWSAAATAWLALFRGIGRATLLGGLLGGLGSVAAGAATSFFGDRTGAPAPTRLFSQIERAAAAAGYERRPGEPPAAFLNRLAEAYPSLARRLMRFRNRYLAARFGGREFDPDTRRQVERSVGEICDEL